MRTAPRLQDPRNHIHERQRRVSFVQQYCAATNPKVQRVSKIRDSNVAMLEPVGAKIALRDQVFADRTPPGDFSFNPQVAQVFDDMVSRSVPFYDEMQRMTTEIAGQFAQDGTNLYDLGCATGTTLALLDPVVSDKVRFVGIDNAQSMLNKARAKLDLLESKRPYTLVCADLHDRPGSRTRRSSS